jgi:hypothetical protein
MSRRRYTLSALRAKGVAGIVTRAFPVKMKPYATAGTFFALMTNRLRVLSWCARTARERKAIGCFDL